GSFTGLPQNEATPSHFYTSVIFLSRFTPRKSRVCRRFPSDFPSETVVFQHSHPLKEVECKSFLGRAASDRTTGSLLRWLGFSVRPSDRMRRSVTTERRCVASGNRGRVHMETPDSPPPRGHSRDASAGNGKRAIVVSQEKPRWHVSASNRVGPSHFCDTAAGGLTNSSASRRTI